LTTHNVDDRNPDRLLYVHCANKIVGTMPASFSPIMQDVRAYLVIFEARSDDRAARATCVEKRDCSVSPGPRSNASQILDSVDITNYDMFDRAVVSPRSNYCVIVPRTKYKTSLLLVGLSSCPPASYSDHFEHCQS